MKTFYRVFTHHDEFFDFPAVGTIWSFVVNGRIEGGFLQEAVFIPFGEMRLILRIEVAAPVAFMTPAGQA